MPRMTMPSRFPATANDLATAAMRSMNQHLELGCRLTFDGRLDPEVLRRAVRMTLDAQPVLGCGLLTDFRSGWWERIGGLDNHVPFSVIETAVPEAEAATVQTASVPDEGPQVAVALLRTPERDEVCFRISHCVADGQATKQYAYLLAETYSRLLGDPDCAPRICLDERPSAEDMWRRVPRERRREAGREPKPAMPNWVLPRKGATGEGRTLRELRLAPERFRTVKAYGKERNCTVNEMLLTAFFRAVLRHYPQAAGRPLSLAFSADHRRYLGDVPEIPIANLAITIWLGVETRPGEPFDETLRRVAGQIALWRNALWGAKSAVKATGMTSIGYKPMQMVMKGIAKMSSGSGKTSPIFTNIGIIDERRLAFGGMLPSSARLSGPAAFGASLVPTISTYLDTLTVSMGYCEQDMATEDVLAVLDAMDAELAQGDRVAASA